MTCTGMAFFPTNFMLQASHEDDHHQHQTPNSLNQLLPPCTTQDFHGVGSFLGKRSSMTYSGIHDQVGTEQEGNNGEDDLSDDGSQAGEKKRRLNMEQVKTLERNFELGNKLDPERKMQLARALGLQPRQIAIWFQNRRARWKTKQLEKDYDVLKRQFEAIKAENDSLQAQNQKLHAEILTLKNREPTEAINLNIKETEGSCSNRSENSSENIHLDIISRTTNPAIDSPLSSHHHHHHIPTSINLFPSPNQNTLTRSTTPHQLFLHNSSSRPDLQLQCQQPKIMDQTTPVKEESFSNMFCGIEDPTGFWPWLENQQFN